jgi:hypothetical protein
MERHPYTLLVAGYAHTFDYRASERQVIVGNGGPRCRGTVE